MSNPTADPKLPPGARLTKCNSCGWTYGTHAPDCERVPIHSGTVANRTETTVFPMQYSGMGVTEWGARLLWYRDSKLLAISDLGRFDTSTEARAAAKRAQFR